MVKLHYDKDEFRLIAKKGKGIRTVKNNVAYSKSGKVYSNPKNRNHVVVKITGGAKTAGHAREHLNYITRNDGLPLFDENGSLIPLRRAKAEINKVFDDLSGVRADARRCYNVVFSRSGKTDPILLADIVRETVSKQFPHNKFYYAVHEDTDNNHIHVVIERKGKTRQSRLLEINKRKLNELKKAFAEIQNKHGLKSIFLSETDKQKSRDTLLNTKEDKQQRANKRKGANEYTVLDFDKAPYKFDENGKPSFYLLLQTKNNEKKFHWSWGLYEELQKKGVRIGDKVTLKKVRSFDAEHVSDNGMLKKSSWEISVLEQAQDGLSLEQFKVVDFGKAPYKFDEAGKPSYYVIMQNRKGEAKDYWGKAFEQIVAEQGIAVGDKIKFDNADTRIFNKVIDTDIQQVQSIRKAVDDYGFKV